MKMYGTTTHTNKPQMQRIAAKTIIPRAIFRNIIFPS